MSLFHISVFTEGKTAGRNEDSILSNEHTVALADGVTDKSGRDFNGKTGGEVASKIATETALSSSATGQKLVDQISQNLTDSYRKYSQSALKDSAYRIATTLLTVRIADNQVIITQVGDCLLRVNGSEIYGQSKLIDTLAASLRSQYIAETGDIRGSREVIMPLLKSQHIYRNNADHPLGFGAIDGSTVPSKFVSTFSLPLAELKTLELVSDGYYGAFPSEVSIEAYEKLHQKIQQTDPNKFKEYPSTKNNDDRTVAILTFTS